MKVVPTKNLDFNPLLYFIFKSASFLFLFFFVFFCFCFFCFLNNQIFIFEFNESITAEKYLFACYNMHA